MYNEQLEQLIDAALADGELTEKEKQILFKKAQSFGIDLDEFEMVLDARIVKLQKEEKEKAAQSAPKSNKLGDVRKCPQCGAVIGSFQMVCPECGFEFSGIGPNKFVEKFSVELQNTLEKQNGGKRSLFEVFDPSGMYEEKRKNKALAKAESNFVKNYPLPMTKEDCVEMLNYILPKTHLSGSNGATRAWRSKYDAILTKMERENQNNPKVLELVASYKAQSKMSGFGKFVLWYKSLSTLAKSMVWLIPIYVLFFGLGGYFLSSSLDSTKGMDKVQQLVDEGNINGAKMEVKKGSNSQPLYDYYMENKMWEEAEEFIPKEYSEVSNEDYYDYCKKVVTIMCEDGDFEAAKKFIKRKVVFYEENNDTTDYDYKEWNTTIVEKKLNAIVENY